MGVGQRKMRSARAQSLSFQTRVGTGGLPRGGVGAALSGADRRERACNATPQRIPVTAEIAEIGCN